MPIAPVAGGDGAKFGPRAGTDRWVHCLGVLVFALLAPIAHADEALARERACFACHMVDKKLVGPAWRDVAVRYAGDRTAEARLARKIREGGAGVWGTLAMAPNPAVTEAESVKLARWVLSLNTPR